MSYNSTLQLIGKKETIFLPYKQAKQVDAVFSDEKIPSDFVIKLRKPEMSFRKGNIRIIEANPDGNSNAGNEDTMRKFYEEERLNLIKYLSWTKEKLASYTDIFEGLYKISSGQEAKPEDVEKAKQIQLKFFRDNPKRTLCDLDLFKPIIPMIVSRIDVWQTGFFRLAEKAIFRDMQLSGQLKQNVKIPIPVEAKKEESIEDMKIRAKVNRDMDQKFSDTVAHALNNF